MQYNWFNRNNSEDHNFWISYTDLMAGFLVVFIILSVLLYYQFNIQLEKTKEAENQANIARVQYEQETQKLNLKLKEMKIAIDSLDALRKKDLKNQIYKYRNVFIYDENIKVDFNSLRGSIILTPKKPKGELFASGDSIMQPILRRYMDKIGYNLVARTMDIWKENGYKNVELRIEGHTDPTWGRSRASDESFVKNLHLSSKRANNVYDHILNRVNLTQEQRDFVKRNMISIGYSFSARMQQNPEDLMNPALDAESRRIEFRIISR